MPRGPFKRKPKRRRHGQAFWEREYTNSENLALSTAPSADLQKFLRWLDRQDTAFHPTATDTVLDLGCGNGRNLIYLNDVAGAEGVGYDTAAAALKAARVAAGERPLTFTRRSIAEPLLLEDESVALALDMMSSHFLPEADRRRLRDEVYRVLKPGGWLFFKTFLRDDDLHTKRLLADHPGNEEGTYIHPVIGVPEHAYFEDELVEFLKEKFVIHKIYRSHKHKLRGKARKRRTISIYAQKDPYS